ncbi:hypothetical protein J6590_089962 [Homalodisca vitripennis]|nr:hypothetical protein J6590_089962 [Homalodisca vitripennis]
MARPAAVVPVSSFQRTRPDTDFPVHGTYRTRLAGSSAHSEPLPRLTYRTESVLGSHIFPEIKAEGHFNGFPPPEGPRARWVLLWSCSPGTYKAGCVIKNKLSITIVCKNDERPDNWKRLHNLQTTNRLLSRDHFWLVYTFQLNLPLAQQNPMWHLNLGNLMDFQERHITNRKCRDSGVQGQFDRSSLLREMTVGVGGVRFLISDVLPSLDKGIPPPTCFDWKGWFRAGLPFFRGDMTLRLVP